MIIQLRKVTRTFPIRNDRVTALADVNLEIEAGKLICLCGPSGSGKSTLLFTMGGMLRPDSGTVRVLDRDLYALSKSERAAFRASQLGFIFQDFHLVPYLTVRENVLLPLGHLRKSAQSNQQDCDQLLARLGLSHRLDHKPRQLSAGDRQRTAIARATLLKPPILLADEPTGNLDEDSAEEVYRLLTEYREQGGTVLVVTHTRSAWTYADQVIQIVEGQLQVNPSVHRTGTSPLRHSTEG